MTPKLAWQTLDTKLVYDNKWICVEEHNVITPAGHKSIYGKVHFKNQAVGVIALDDAGFIYLVGQHRYTLRTWSWEIPEGGNPDGSDPLLSAKRELREETGLSAEHWSFLLRIHLSNSVSDEEGFIFLAQQLTQGSCEREATEADMTVKKISLDEALAMVEQGIITDSLSVIGILKVARMQGK